MKIDRVRYDKKFSIGPYLTDSVGIEAQVDADETPELVLTTLKTIVEDWHYSQYRAKEVALAEADNAKYQQEKQTEIDKEFDNLHRLLKDIEYREDALNLIEKTSFKFNVELKAIAKSKPSKK
jgi:hypothetical protein